MENVNGIEDQSKANYEEIYTNVYERNSIARQKCLDHHGYSCKVCGKQMEHIYGIVAKYIIEVHHIVPLSEIGKQYVIDPIKDLVPVCPDCHTIIHLKTSCYKIEEIQRMIIKDTVELTEAVKN